LSSEIQQFLYRRVADLSAGERQKITIALANVSDRKLILADESTANLDIRNARLFFESMRRLVEEYQVTVVAVTHDILLAAEFADNIYVIETGTVSRMAIQPDMGLDERICLVKEHFV